ncbi:MAG: hypothetical protein WDZ41_00340 [Candidatus Babeliales bacterium]
MKNIRYQLVIIFLFVTSNNVYSMQTLQEFRNKIYSVIWQLSSDNQITQAIEQRDIESVKSEIIKKFNISFLDPKLNCDESEKALLNEFCNKSILAQLECEKIHNKRKQILLEHTANFFLLLTIQGLLAYTIYQIGWNPKSISKSSVQALFLLIICVSSYKQYPKIKEFKHALFCNPDHLENAKQICTYLKIKQS